MQIKKIDIKTVFPFTESHNCILVCIFKSTESYTAIFLFQALKYIIDSF